MTNILTILLIVYGMDHLIQSNEKLKSLFDKKWQITTFEISGQQVPASENGSEDYTIFYQDFGVITVERGISTLAKWKYDNTNNTITIYSENIPETTEMKIFVLNDKEFIWETINPEGITMTISMINISE